MRKIAVLAAAALMVGPMTAHALLINYGTGELVGSRNCIAGVTACDSLSGFIAEAFGGFPGAANSVVSTTTFPGTGGVRLRHEQLSRVRANTGFRKSTMRVKGSQPSAADAGDQVPQKVR